MPRHLALFFPLLLIIWLVAASGTYADEGALSAQIRARIEVLRDAGNERAKTQAHPHPRQLRDLTMTEAVSQFYEYRNFKPAWTKPKTVAALLRELGEVRADGLDPDDYRFSELLQRQPLLVSGSLDPAAQAGFELMATEGYLRALAHLFRGKVKPTSLDAQWNFSLHDIAATEAFGVVSAAVDSGNLTSAFDAARPQHRIYLNARQALATLRGIDAKGGWPTLATTTTLKPGMQDAEIRALRQRLAIAGYLPADRTDSDLFDDELVAAVRTFQREQYLDPDGAIGPATRTALNVPVSARIDQVRVNLERGRWLLHDIPEQAVVVDVAGYKVYFLKQGKRVWEASVQVGKPYRSTPIFRSDITYVTFNPTWTVPPTIYRKDLLPKIRRNPAYLAQNNMRVLTPTGSVIDPASVNWNSPGHIVLRADAGPENPLGQVAIRFPNPYSVYLHDTSHKELFGSSRRAFSSGCIRVERPLELVEMLLNDPVKWNRAAIDAKIAEGKTRNIDLAKPVPLLLAYWTVDVLDSQHIVFKPDIYSHDAPLLKALNRRLQDAPENVNTGSKEKAAVTSAGTMSAPF